MYHKPFYPFKILILHFSYFNKGGGELDPLGQFQFFVLCKNVYLAQLIERNMMSWR